MITGKLRIIGQIDVVELDQPEGKYGYARALLIEFDSDDEIRQALKDDGCRFTFGDQDTESQPMKFQVQELRPEVLAFALLMEQRLRDKDADKDADKGQGWKQKTDIDLIVNICTAARDIEQGLFPYKGERSIKSLVDMSNHCMMLADVLGALS